MGDSSGFFSSGFPRLGLSGGGSSSSPEAARSSPSAGPRSEHLPSMLFEVEAFVFDFSGEGSRAGGEDGFSLRKLFALGPFDDGGRRKGRLEGLRPSRLHKVR